MRLFRINGLGGNCSHIIDPKRVITIQVSAKDLAVEFREVKVRSRVILWHSQRGDSGCQRAILACAFSAERRGVEIPNLTYLV